MSEVDERNFYEKQMNEQQIAALTRDMGGAWCHCIDRVIAEISVEKLAVYCQTNYEPFHPPTADESAVRYSYYLKTEQIPAPLGTNEAPRDRHICANFGSYNRRPCDTLKTCLEAIAMLAVMEDRSPQEVAEDVIQCDASLAPPVRREQGFRAELPPQRKRSVQSNQNFF